MNQKQIRAAVEAMLFAYAEPIGAAQAGPGAAAAHRQRGICAGSAARALPERGQRPVPAPPEHPLADGY